MAESAISVRCLVLPDGSVPRRDDDDDVIAQRELIEQPAAVERQADRLEKLRRHSDPRADGLILSSRGRSIFEIEVVAVAAVCRRAAVGQRNGLDARQRLHGEIVDGDDLPLAGDGLYALGRDLAPATRRGTEIAQSLSSTTKTTGSDHSAARLSDSWNAPWLAAPSPVTATAIRSVPRRWKAKAWPSAGG